MEHLIYRLGITPAKARALLSRMQRLGIKKADVAEKFIRSSGRGGQKVNKTSSCVYLKHLPTGIEVKMQRERSQSLNRFLAWRLLTDKLEQRRRYETQEVQQETAKIRRQTSPRPHWLKETILKTKKFQSRRKQLRQIPDELDTP